MAFVVFFKKWNIQWNSGTGNDIRNSLAHFTENSALLRSLFELKKKNFKAFSAKG